MADTARLSDEQWTAVPFDAPALAFLRAEWDKWAVLTQYVDRRLVLQPNLAERPANHLRTTLLYMARGKLLNKLPADTEWFEVKSLRGAHLHQLRVIGRCGWDDPADGNELAKVAARRPRPLSADASSWSAPLLWGHNRDGPFTILEGNNRLVAFAGLDQAVNSLELPCYVGVSAKPCHWHLADDFKALEGAGQP